MSSKMNNIKSLKSNIETDITNAIIYKDELNYISRCILDYPNIETGGNLFGFWTHSGMPVIQYVVGPSRHANHQVTFFNQDNEYLQEIGNKLISQHGLQHIGDWHSHHSLGLKKPSNHDANTMVKVIDKVRLNQLLLIIGTCNQGDTSINGFLFNKINRLDYSQVIWNVLPGQSPIRNAFDSKFRELVHYPMTKDVSFIEIKANNSLPNVTKPQFPQNYWLESKENQLELKTIYDYLKSDFQDVKILTDENNLVYIDLRDKFDKIKILFPVDFPQKPPLIRNLRENIFEGVTNKEEEADVWNIKNGISKTTIELFKKIIQKK